MSRTDQLIAGLLSDQLSADERLELISLLKTDDGLREKLAAHASMEGWIGVALEDDVQRETRVSATLARLRDIDREVFVAGVKDRVVRFRWKRRVLALAAVVILAFLTVFSWNWISGGSVVATIERQESANWRSGSSQTRVLKAGAHLQLSSGLVELRIADKGRMVLEGPANLEFVSGSQSILHQGRVVMRVTEAGHGYRLETPGGSVVDLGTEFGVSVGASGSVETHVLEGQVEATPSGGSKVILNKDDGLRFVNGSSERIASETGSFYTVLPPQHQNRPSWVHWSFEDASADEMAASVSGFEGDSFGMKLLGVSAGQKPRSEAAVFGKGLAFDGTGSYAESGFRGIGGKAPRTVCFWLRVPVDFSPDEGYGILSWGQFAQNNPGGTWQISVNPASVDGPIGRLRVGTHRGQVIGSSDLRDGRWHHIAVVMYPGSHPDVGKHVLLYIDGSLDEVSQRALREIDTEVESAEHGVWLGRNVSFTNESARREGKGFFRGGLDEVFIFGAALSSDEVRSVMKSNQVPW